MCSQENAKSIVTGPQKVSHILEPYSVKICKKKPSQLVKSSLFGVLGVLFKSRIFLAQ
jgi:hypothetical protein